MTRDVILTELYGGLWHTTNPERFEGILQSGRILPEPKLPDADRWKTSLGKDRYPYVRDLGGVSLFDFDQFDPDSYSKEYPLSSWYEFVPYRQVWGRVVWIEIDRHKVSQQLISPSELVVRWKAEGAFRHTIMPYIEAAHIGFLPKTVFKRAFLVCKEDSDFHPLSFQ